MNIIKCAICRIVLPEISTSSICDKQVCRESIEHRQSLHERIEMFSTFWTDKTPNESNYETYLNMVGLEDTYKSIAIIGENPPKFSRRSWYNANIIQSHHEWPDEFGRLRDEIV
jgi:hypothetical protein